jgi:hypothetical protein
MKMSKPVRILLGFLLLGIIGSALFFLLRYLFRGFFALPKEVETTLLTISGTILVSVGTLVLSKRAEQKRQIEEDLRKQKVPIYQEFLEFLFGTFFADKVGKMPPSETEIKAFFAQFTPKIIIWGSDGVIREFLRFRNAPAAETSIEMTKRMALAVERIMYEIRKDVGHKNKNLVEGNLLSMFINDVETLVPAPKARSAARL